MEKAKTLYDWCEVAEHFVLNGLVVVFFVCFVARARQIYDKLIGILVGEARSVKHPVNEVAYCFCGNHCFVKSC